jgi:hypothetical protein
LFPSIYYDYLISYLPTEFYNRGSTLKENIRKYRHAILLLLITFAANIVLPSAHHAVTLFCQMETTPQLVASVSDKSVECCPEVKTENADKSASTDQIESCTFRAVCQQSFSHSLIDLTSPLPMEKLFAKAIWPTQTVSNHIQDKGLFNYLSLNTSLSFSTPPIFLMNSTFLN